MSETNDKPSETPLARKRVKMRNVTNNCPVLAVIDSLLFTGECLPEVIDDDDQRISDFIKTIQTELPIADINELVNELSKLVDKNGQLINVILRHAKVVKNDMFYDGE